MSIDGDDARPRAAVPRPRDAEPDRVRRDLSAARGTTRPVRAADRLRLPGRRRRVGDARAAPRARDGRGRAPAGHRPARRCSRCSRRSRTSTSTRASAATSSTSSPRRARAERVGRREPARLARARGALALPRCARGTGLRHAGRRQERGRPGVVAPAGVRPELWVQRRSGEDVVREILAEVRRRPPRAPRPREAVGRSSPPRLCRTRGGRVRRGARPPSGRAGGRCSAVRTSRRAGRQRRRAGRPRLVRARPRARPGEGRARSDDDRPLRVRRRSARGRRRRSRPGSRWSRDGTRSPSISLRARNARFCCASGARAGRPSRSATSGSAHATASASCATRAGLTGASHSGSTPVPSACGDSSHRRTRRRRPGARSPRYARKGSSSPTRGRSSPATSSGRSTGGRPRGGAPSSSTSGTRSGTPTSSSSSTASPRRGRPQEGTLELAVRAAATLAEPVPRAPRPRRAGRPSAASALARAGQRARPAVPPRRRAARDRRAVQLRLEGRQHHPGTNAAATRARRRAHAAPRRAVGRAR